MSWKRCSGFFTVTPMYCCASGHGLRAEREGTGSRAGRCSSCCLLGGNTSRCCRRCLQTSQPTCCCPTIAAHTAISDRPAPEGVVKVEQALLGFDAQEGGHVLKVGQCGRQAHQADHLLGGLRGGWEVGEEQLGPCTGMAGRGGADKQHASSPCRACVAACTS